MQFQFTNTAELEFPFEQLIEVEITVTAEYTPASRGSRGAHGEPEEPDEDAEIEILSIVDANGKEYEPEEIENIHSLCWDHFENNEE